MADPPQPLVQPRATTAEGIKIEEYARRLLAGLIVQSVEEGIEYGGVICRNNATGLLRTTGPFKGYSGANVDIGVWTKENCGCDDGTTPVAWYHTHPTTEIMTRDGLMHMLWDEFIEGDKLISDGFLIPGYVGTMDRRFWRYDPPPSVMFEGKPVVTEGKGTYGVLNGKLVPPRKPLNIPVIPPRP
ncbi:MAG: DUF4329 domain-containing protein [Burkholderiales bacterium]